MQRVAARDAAIKMLDKPYLDLTTPIECGILAFLSAMAEDARQRIHKHSREGRAAARTLRKPELAQHQRRVEIKRLATGESGWAIARDMGVARTTVGRLAH
jgi:DNA invertase Pin-like site-specific DNA recombinase